MRLPAYQLYHFITTKGYCKYGCSTCTGNVPDHVLKDVDAYETSNNNKVFLRCKIISELEEENQLKTEEIIKISKVNRTLEKRQEILRNAMQQKDTLVKINQDNNMRRKSDETIGIDNYAITMECDKQLNDKFHNFSTQLLTEVYKLINEKFSNLAKRFEGMTKTSDFGKQISTTAEKERNRNCKTFAAKLTKGIPISSDNTPILRTY